MLKRILVVTAILTSCFALVTPLIAQPKVSVVIVEVVPNKRISGRVVGIPGERVGDYKVLVYVKTDKWYIHPFEDGGAGKSFASINGDGSWTIDTVKRDFLAKMVAALVVQQSYTPPSTVRDLGEVQRVAVYQEEGGGRL